MRMKIPNPLGRLLADPAEWPQLVMGSTSPRKALRGGKTGGMPATPEDLTEVTGFGRNVGNLRMLEYVPPGAGAAMPLVVVLHGCFQNAGDFDQGSGWSALARACGFALLYAEQKPSNNANLCFNWFRPSQVTKDRGELGTIREMIESSCEKNSIDRDRIFVMGLSAGGAMASALLANYPEVFAGGAIIGGLPFGSARDAMGALLAMKTVAARTPDEWGELVKAASPDATQFPPVAIWHGTDDHVVSFGNAEASVSQWLAVHGQDPDQYHMVRFDGGTRQEWRDGKGRAIVEFVRLDDLDHGMPVGPVPPSPPTDQTGRFLLSAPISAPEQLVRRWKLDQ